MGLFSRLFFVFFFFDLLCAAYNGAKYTLISCGLEGEEVREMGRDYGEVVNGHTKEIVNCIEMHTTCGYCKLINKMWSTSSL